METKQTLWLAGILLVVIVVAVGLTTLAPSREGVDMLTRNRGALVVNVLDQYAAFASEEESSASTRSTSGADAGWMSNQNDLAGFRFESPEGWSVSPAVSLPAGEGKTIHVVRAQRLTIDPNAVYFFSTDLSLEEAREVEIVWERSFPIDKTVFEEESNNGRSIITRWDYSLRGFNVKVNVTHLSETNGRVYGSLTQLDTNEPESEYATYMRTALSLEPL